MRTLLVAGAVALASALICAHPASAFTTYYEGGGSGASAGYADPSDQLRSQFGLGSGSGPDRSFDRATMPAQSVIVNQGVLSPGWYFRRPRR